VAGSVWLVENKGRTSATADRWIVGFLSLWDVGRTYKGSFVSFAIEVEERCRSHKEILGGIAHFVCAVMSKSVKLGRHCNVQLQTGK
jgi:hypothetical protein